MRKCISMILIGLFMVMTIMPFPVMSPSKKIVSSTISETHTPSTLSQADSTKMRISVIADEAVEPGLPSWNYHNNTFRGGLWVGRGYAGLARSWVKFDLSIIPEGVHILSASLNLYMFYEFRTVDVPIGVYYSPNDNWTEQTITSGNAPTPSTTASDVYDTGVSPEMFVNHTWYSWDISDDVRDAYTGDGVLSEMLRIVNESDPSYSWKYFVEKDFNSSLASYIEVEYAVPEVGQVTVDGYSSSPMIDFIQNDTPTIGWNIANPNSGTQKDYKVEVWDTPYYNGTKLMGSGGSNIVSVSTSGDTLNTRPFGTPQEMRFQFKFMNNLLTHSGLIDKIYLGVHETSGTAVFQDLDIYLLQVENSSALTHDTNANYDNVTPINVLHTSTYAATVQNGYLVFDVENTFVITQTLNLIIEIQFSNNTGNLFHAVHSTGSSSGSVAYSYGDGVRVENYSTFTYNRLHNLKLAFASDSILDSSNKISNYYPFGVDEGTPGRLQFKYNASLFSETGLIDRIFYITSKRSGSLSFDDLVIRMVETPVKGPLNATNMDLNYGGVTPTTVLSRSHYSVPNYNGTLIFDLDNVFTYSGQNDLLVEFEWSSRAGDRISAYRVSGGGGYRAYNLTAFGGNHVAASDLAYSMYVEFIHNENSITYTGSALTNNTQYYVRVRVCTALGVWSEWATQSFKYAKLTSVPSFSNLQYPDPAHVGQAATISIDVTYFLGIHQVLFEIQNHNYTMTASGSRYSYDWTPSAEGNYTFTIYMESTIGTWSNTTGTIRVVQSTGGLPISPNTLIMIFAALAVIVIIIIVMKRRK